MTNLLTRTRWTMDDLAALPDDGTRYEIIDGELFMASAPHWKHQRAGNQIFRALEEWSEKSGLGEANTAPGLVFDPINGVIPDVVWISYARLAAWLDAAGHLNSAPELVVEILSPGRENERRDRELKLALYARWDVQEYWIVDWPPKQIEVYQRDGGRLRLATTLHATDTLTSPLLPGFACPVARLFI